jgi:P-type Ca2+ transporter type 2C
MDDDLFHMTEAVALGRRIYENLKKAILYIISIHIPIILIVTLPLILFWQFNDLFSPIHVIFLELIMGPTCSIVFEKEPIEKNSMKQAPRKMSLTFFSLPELSLSIVQGMFITFACLGLGYSFMKSGSSEKEVRTIVFATLIFSNLFLTLVNRSFTYSFISTLKNKNNLLPIVLIISLAVLIMSIYLPTIRDIFEFSVLSFKTLLLCLGMGFAGVIWVEVYKFYNRHKTKQYQTADI